MKKSVKPKVRALSKGENLLAKEMSANAGDLLPKHLANAESVLVVIAGEGIMHINHQETTLKPGVAFNVPANVKHQIEAKSDFKAVHVMPNDIQFEFFN